jgi:hypothetical protein
MATFLMPANGLELSCPAEAGRHTRIVCLAGGQDKHPRKRRPLGQLQRVVSPLALANMRLYHPDILAYLAILPKAQMTVDPSSHL